MRLGMCEQGQFPSLPRFIRALPWCCTLLSWPDRKWLDSCLTTTR